MALLDQHKLAIFVDVTETPDATDFRRRVQVAMHKTAVAVQGEAQSALTLQQWQKRAALATTILGTVADADGALVAASSAWLDAFALGVVTNASITAASTDNDIEFQVAAIWDDVAGITGQDLT